MHVHPSPSGTDMLQVAVHEIGHTLGLQHSTDPGSVMSAIYSFSYPPQLSKDDEMRIQSLYGIRPVQQREPELDTNDIMLVVSRTVFSLLWSLNWLSVDLTEW